MERERAQREQLENLQVELRKARAALTTAEEDARHTEAELKTKLAVVEARHAAAKARLETLEAERDLLTLIGSLTRI